MPHQTNPNTQDIISCLRLIRSQNVGRSAFFNLIEIFGSAQNALENLAEYSLKGGREKPIIVCSKSEAEKEFEQTTKFGAKILTFYDSDYPKLLKEIPDAPAIITVLGDISLLEKNILSIVGPRNASFNGCKFARKIASDLGQKDFVIASGMARGIDTAAHLGSIATGTIAVIAGGIDNIYPKENENLYREIAKQGLIISENIFGENPRASSFPQRNRIISGLALGTIVVEATIKSGTLITARCAIEQNREVFAVPGSPFDPRCGGTNRLIKDGAKLIENVEDILQELVIFNDNIKLREPEGESFINAPIKTPNEEEINSVRKLILSKIDYSPIAIDEIIADLQISPRIINIALVQLELADKIENKNGKVCLIKFT